MNFDYNEVDGAVVWFDSSDDCGVAHEVISDESSDSPSFAAISDVTKAFITAELSLVSGFLETNDVMRRDDFHEVGIISFAAKNAVNVVDVPRDNSLDPVHREEDAGCSERERGVKGKEKEERR